MRLPLFVLLAATLVLRGAMPAAEPPATANTPNEQLVLRYYTAVNEGDLAAIESLLAPEFRSHASLEGTPKNRAEFQQYLALLRTAFPDTKIEILEWVSAGETTICRYRFTGTHAGKFLNLRPTRKVASVGGIDAWKIREGRLAELHGHFDTFGLLVQLGLVPPIK